MISMSTVESIRQKYRNGMSITQICREEKVDYKTVVKYIQQDDFSEQLPVKTEKPKVTDAYKDWLTELLEENKNNWYKQKLTAKRVYKLLKAAFPEATLSYASINRFVTKWRKAQKKDPGFSHLVWAPGIAQADFGEADFDTPLGRLRLKYFVLSFPQSNKAFVQLFRGENCECVLQGLLTIFEYIGGVPVRIIFDNATGIGRVVCKVLEENPVFTRFRIHYGFESRFCNPYAGHEKGNVETNVGYIRRNLFTPVITIPSSDFQEYNETELFTMCEKLMAERKHYVHNVPVNQLFEKDMEELLPLPAKRFEAKRILNKKTDNYSNVTLENIHKYTLPPEYRNSEVIVETWAWKVAIYDLSGKLIEEYDREYGETRTESISAVTSINALVRKPGSWNNSIFRSNLADGNPFKDYIDGLHDEELKHRIFYEFRKAMNTFEYHVVMQSFTEMASRDIDMTKECNVAACCSRIESCPIDFSYNPTGVSLDKYGCFMKFTEEDYAEV